MLALTDECTFVLFPSEARFVAKQRSLVDKCGISFVHFLELSCLVLFLQGKVRLRSCADG